MSWLYALIAASRRKACLGAVRFKPVVNLTLTLVMATVWIVGSWSFSQTAPSPFTADAVPAFEIGVGDELSVFNLADSSREQCIVRPDGNITLPLVGELVAAGRHPLALTAEIEEKLTKYFDKPEVTVAVQQIHSYRIYMLGKVGAQSMVESIAPLRLLQAISIAGGLNEFANEKIVILRDSGGKQVRHQVDYGKILKGSDPDGNIWLLSGDIVVAQ